MTLRLSGSNNERRTLEPESTGEIVKKGLLGESRPHKAVYKILSSLLGCTHMDLMLIRTSKSWRIGLTGLVLASGRAHLEESQIVFQILRILK